MPFILPPFWAREAYGASAPHAVSVLVTAPAIEPITLTEAKLRAGLDWTVDAARDALMNAFIAAARSKVEKDTSLALLTQTRDVYLDAITTTAITLPAQSLPLQSVTSIKSTDSAGVVTTFASTNYVVDLASARIGLALGSSWPSDLRPFQPYVLRIVSGWVSAALLLAEAPLLVHAVGLLTAHYATLGRDLASIDPATEIPFGYEDAISAYVPVSLA
jgi:uncharacterized phiE125 gp8 family phage protein